MRKSYKKAAEIRRPCEDGGQGKCHFFLVGPAYAYEISYPTFNLYALITVAQAVAINNAVKFTDFSLH